MWDMRLDIVLDDRLKISSCIGKVFFKHHCRITLQNYINNTAKYNVKLNEKSRFFAKKNYIKDTAKLHSNFLSLPFKVLTIMN